MIFQERGLFLLLPTEVMVSRTDFADIQNKKECGGNRQWQARIGNMAAES